VVIDSERVYVDNLLQKRGDDYNRGLSGGNGHFRQKTIDLKAVIQIYYDYRQTVYQHATYGVRGYFKPVSGIKAGGHLPG